MKQILFNHNAEGWQEFLPDFLSSEEWLIYADTYNTPYVSGKNFIQKSLGYLNVCYQHGSLDYKFDLLLAAHFVAQHLSFHVSSSLYLLGDIAYKAGLSKKNQTEIGGLGDSLKTSNNALLDTSPLIESSLTIRCKLAYEVVEALDTLCDSDLIPFDIDAGYVHV